MSTTTSSNDGDDNELMVLPKQALQATVLDIKRQALAAKQQGDDGQALQLLKEAKTVERMFPYHVDDEEGDDTDIPSTTSPPLPVMYWKKLAVLYKQHNDVERAKKALIRSKQVEKQSQSMEDDTAMDTEDVNSPTETTTTQPPPPPAAAAPMEVTETKRHEDTEDDEMLAALMGQDQDDGESTLEQESSNHESSSPAFTLAEMMEYDMMTEFYSAGMPVPTQDEFVAQILQCKKMALQNKQSGDIPKATRHLKYAKQLQHVQQALQQLGHGSNAAAAVGDASDDQDNEAFMKSLNAEDNALLRELLQDEPSANDTNDNDLGEMTSSVETLTVEEVESMDDPDLNDFIEMMGRNSLPTVDDLNERAVQEQKRAIEFKQAKKLDMAKISLLNSKRAKAQADRLERIFAKLDSKSSGDTPSNDEPASLDDLEALMNAPPKKITKEKPKAIVPPQPQDPWLSKPSAEIKMEVIRLKNAKQIKEATQLLQTLKMAIQKEQEQAEAERCRKMLESLQKQISVCQTQISLWQHYAWFIDPAIGSQEYDKWIEYLKTCQKASQQVESAGSSSVTITKSTTISLRKIDDDIVAMLERGLYTSKEKSDLKLDNHLEISVLGILEMEKNEKLQRALRKEGKEKNKEASHRKNPNLRIDAKVQLPLDPKDPSHPIHLAYKPAASNREGSSLEYIFEAKNSKHRLDLPKRDSKEFKTLLRRMETKTVQFNIYLSHEEEKQTSGGGSWFFGRKSSQEEEKDPSDNDKEVLLGKATVNLNTLLLQPALAENVPLVINNKENGGYLRICLRVFPCLNEELKETIDGTPPRIGVYANTLDLAFNS